MDDIVEVIETGRRGCNYLLDNGYRLLDVTTISHEQSGKNNVWVKRTLIYVLGRPKGLDPVSFDSIPRGAATRGATEQQEAIVGASV